MLHDVAVPKSLSALQEVMVHLCSGEPAVLSKQAVKAGCHALLNTMGTEDVIGDAPKAADWVRLGLPAMLLCVHTHTVEHCCCTWTRRQAAAQDSAVCCSQQTCVFCDLVVMRQACHIRGGRSFHINSHEGSGQVSQHVHSFLDVLALPYDLANQCFHVV